MMKKLLQKIKHLYYCGLTLISPTVNTKQRFKSVYGRKINLKQPETFNEKGMYLKLNRYNKDPKVADCADKYTVRKYIEQCGCPEILNNLIAVYDKVSDIDFAALPNEFVIKWNVGCGYNLICPDKSKLDIEKAKKQLKKWGRKKYHLHFSEMQYKGREKKLLVEEFLHPEHGSLPEDYKIYCFGGRAEYVMLCLDRADGKPKCYFFDREWRLARLNKRGEEVPEDFTLPKPDNMEKMFDYAEKLSQGFPFVRVDFFSCNGKVIFGEMTFTPAGFLDPFYTEEAENMLGNKLDLKNI